MLGLTNLPLVHNTVPCTSSSEMPPLNTHASSSLVLANPQKMAVPSALICNVPFSRVQSPTLITPQMAIPMARNRSYELRHPAGELKTLVAQLIELLLDL